MPFLRVRKKLATVRLEGMISSGRLSLRLVGGAISKAFKSGHEVAIVVNSPGGAPAQSQLIFRHIRRMADQTKKPVTVFVEDVAASGGYWIAAAGDRIYALETSLIGSIGVRTDSFGFHGLLDRIGVERRLITTGEKKARLDPFSPLSEDDVQWLKGVQAELHGVFRDSVLARRSLNSTDGIFTGDIWLGREAQEKGLIDGLKTLHEYAEEGGLAVKAVRIKGGTPLLRRLLRRSVDTVLSELEERQAWGRFGL